MDLVFLNYEVPEALLASLVPSGTILDRHDGRLFASLVGFRFQSTALRGWPIPFHGAFEEVNLRFYVRREASPGEVRRGVVFVRELVPRPAVAWLARWLYNEPYRVVPMWHRIDRESPSAQPAAVHYHWRLNQAEYAVGGRLGAPTSAPEAGFITEHYWGYTRQRDGGTLEYQVTHPPWAVRDLVDARLVGNPAPLYGPAWGELLEGRPYSAFYADGSEVAVLPGHRIGATKPLDNQ